MKVSARFRRRHLRGTLIVSFTFLFSCAGLVAAADQAIALKAARLFDGKSKTLMQNGVVIVQGDKIVDLGSNLPIPSDAKVIDLGDATLSPGFMDAHTHLTLDFSGNYNERRLKELDQNVSEHAIKATTWARDTVEAGFTTVRDLWSPLLESVRRADTSIAPPVFGMGFSGVNLVTAKEWPMDRMRFAKPCALRSKMART